MRWKCESFTTTRPPVVAWAPAAARTATTIAANNLHDEERAAMDKSVEYDVATRSVSRARPSLYWALVTSALSYGTLSWEISPLLCNAADIAGTRGSKVA